MFDISKIQINPKFEVFNEASETTAKMYLYGVIREASWWDKYEEDTDFITSKAVRNELQKLGGKNLEVHINSKGGDVFESIAIRNNFKQYAEENNTEVVFVIDSLGGSGASLIPTAGKVHMYVNSMQMIHDAWTFAMGNAKVLRKVADKLDKISTSVLKSYLNKFVGTEEELKNLMEEDLWLTAEECLAFGFCDKIIDEEAGEEEKSVLENSTKNTLFNKYGKNIQAKAGGNKPSLFNVLQNKNLGGNE